MIELREGFQVERDSYYDKVNYVDPIELTLVILWVVLSGVLIWVTARKKINGFRSIEIEGDLLDMSWWKVIVIWTGGTGLVLLFTMFVIYG